MPAQQGYQAACEAFNAGAGHRNCSNCGSEAPTVDLAPFRWEQVVETILTVEEGEDEVEHAH